MKDKAAHACRALCRARLGEELQRRRGTRIGEHPDQLFVPRVHVVPDAGDGSAPCIIVAALAGIVHHRQAASGYEHGREGD